MNKVICFLAVLLLFAQCKNNIKNEDAKVVQEEGTAISDSIKPKALAKSEPIKKNALYGFWVGDFVMDLDEAEATKKKVRISPDGIREWNRENKINISIDKIEGEKVTGHSVVAGNSRAFNGTIKKENGAFNFEVNEAGDQMYDGKFNFTIKDTLLEGIWQAFGKIEIQKRKYSLAKKVFKYNPDIMLEYYGTRRFINWTKTKKDPADDGQGYYSALVATSTDSIYRCNASNKILTKKDVENLKKGDLLVIRNTIYARHGYSFKNRQLRIFFDNQSWYIPVYSDIKNEFTEIEKKNIQLLLRYEKNAKEYYDYFGRG